MLYCLFHCSLPVADVPQTLHYQGQLRTPEGLLVTGTEDTTFCLYTELTGGTAIWCEDHPSVEVDNGSFNVELGSANTLGELAFDIRYYLGISVGGDEEMTPRLPLSSVPSAFLAEKQQGSTVTVDCDGGNKIMDAVAARAATIKVKGICTEDVFIDRDGITLLANTGGGVDGVTGASANGYAIEVRGARHVVIKDLTVQGNASNGTGIFIDRGSYAKVTGVTVQNSGATGIYASFDTGMELFNSTISNNGGFALVLNGHIWVGSDGIDDAGDPGPVVISGNGHGAYIALGDTLFENTTIENNGGDGAVWVDPGAIVYLQSNTVITHPDTNASGLNYAIGTASGTIHQLLGAANVTVTGPGGSDDAAIVTYGNASLLTRAVTIDHGAGGTAVSLWDSSYAIFFAGTTVTGGVACTGSRPVANDFSGGTVDSVSGCTPSAN